jgi:hypothetical protein
MAGREGDVYRTDMNWTTWFTELDRLGTEQKRFDPPGVDYICGKPRRPYGGVDGFFRQAYNSGMSPAQALAESVVEQDGE